MTHSMKLPFRSDILTILLVVGLLQADFATADVMSALRRAASTGAGIADDIPTRSFDRMTSPVVAPGPGARHLDPDVVRAALAAVDADLLRKIDQLPMAEQRLSLEVFEGGRILKTSNPDALARARLIAAGGPDLLVAAHRHGAQVAKSAYMLQIAEEAGELPAGAVTDFSRIAAARGTPFIVGWNKHIVANWKPMLASGAILSCLAASEACIDATGNLVGEMAEIVSKLAITIGTEVMTGTAVGAGEAAVNAFRREPAWLLAVLCGVVPMLWLMRRRWRSILALPKILAARAVQLTGWRSPNSAPKQTDANTHSRIAHRSLHDRDV